jgi:hypothetical protein
MQTLTQKLERKKDEIGLVGTRLSFSRPKSGKGISEHITRDWKEVVIKIRGDLDPKLDKKTKAYLKKKGIEKPIETIAEDMLFHGCGHRELPRDTSMGCPYTVENHDIILDGIARALKEKGKQGLENYVANAFEDILDNVNAKQHTGFAGQVLFWNNEGLESEGKFSGFYEAFVKINLAMIGDVEDASLLRRFFTNSNEVKGAVKEFKDYLKENMSVGNLVRLDEDQDLVRKLFNKTSWGDMAYKFALATADLLEDEPEMRLCFGVPTDGENYFDKLIKLPETQEDIAEGRYKTGKGPSEHTDPLLQLDSLYRKISRAIPVQTSEYTKTSGIPVAHFGRRNLKEDEVVKPSRIKGVGFDDEGELRIRVSKHQIKHPARYKVHPTQFPKLKIALLDTSGSMRLSPDDDKNVGDKSFIPWGDNSKYHYALKGLYGIDNFLEKQGVAGYVQSEAIVFSGSTIRTGKGKLRNEAERRALLRKPSGGTTIDTKVLEEETGEKCFLVSVSDGEVSNWSGIKDDYKKAIENADYCHIHIGIKNSFTESLESWDVPVKYVKGDEDLSRLMIDLTSQYYREGCFN